MEKARLLLALDKPQFLYILVIYLNLIGFLFRIYFLKTPKLAYRALSKTLGTILVNSLF
jgi:hypothetical protein